MKKRSKLFLFLFFLLPLFTFQAPQKIEVTYHPNLFSNQVEKNSTYQLKNIMIFIRFSDSEANVIHHLDDEESVNNANKILNSENTFEMDTVNGIIDVPSFKKYYEKQSYGKLSITTEIFPKENGKVISYTDIHPIGYYLKYNENNQIGYKNQDEAKIREVELLNRATGYVAKMVADSGITASELDINQDGKIDAISFVVEGQKNLPSAIAWGDMLWAHKSGNSNIVETIQGKLVNDYTLLYAGDYTESASLFSLNRGTYGTMIHEFGHVLGYMDLYRYGESSKPVGFYDVMGTVIGSNPQDFLTYYISEYKYSWHNPLPVITKTTEDITVYKPNYIDKNEQRAVKIEIDGNKDEFFVVEYHEKKNTYETSSADASGIIVYRVNEKNKNSGNASDGDHGENDHVYIFRPNETGLGEGLGNLSQATLNSSRPTLGSDIGVQTTFDPKAIFFSDGSNSGIKIEVTNETIESITFRVIFPKVEGDGSKENPYLIDNVNTFLYLMGINTTNKYYKLMNNLDFSGVHYPNLNFEGNLDGNNKTLKNIQTKGSGIFNSIGNHQTHTRIENLTVENLNVYSNSQDYLGGFANTTDNVTLYNIHLKSGKVIYEGNPINTLTSVGGFLGNVNSTTIIENCLSNVDVTANKNVGGFIGINMNSKIKNSFATGTVQGNFNVGAFIGLQAITDTFYNTPENVYYLNHSIQVVGGYAELFHNLNTLDVNSLGKGIIGISISKELSIMKGASIIPLITTSPSTKLTYNIIIENKEIVKYENGKLEGLKAGSTKIHIDIQIGTIQFRQSCDVVVKEITSETTEKEVLDSLGLIKKDNYVVGFELGTTVKTFKQKISKYKGITLKSFTNDKNIEINDGIIATGMKFTLIFNQKEYNYIVVVKGDINGDDLIYATDYVKVKNYIMGKSKLIGPYLIAADINSDGKVYATDYVLIKNHIMGKKPIQQKI